MKETVDPQWDASSAFGNRKVPEKNARKGTYGVSRAGTCSWVFENLILGKGLCFKFAVDGKLLHLLLAPQTLGITGRDLFPIGIGAQNTYIRRVQSCVSGLPKY